MKVLVTGGAGFIGSHTFLLLIERGYEVVVIDSYVNSNKKSLQRVIDIFKSKKKTNNLNFEIIKADIRDEAKLEKLFSESQISGNPFQAVIHFAGLKSVKDSIYNPLLYWDINVYGSIQLLKVMDKYNCRTIVFSSSATIYNISTEPHTENTLINPINTYGNTKATVEQILNDIYQSNSCKWRIANLRYFNPIGSHPSGKLGESPMCVPDNIFPFITQVAAGKLEKLTIFGNDWATKDGTCVRDYIHIMDLAEAHISTLEYLTRKENQILNLNIGTGIGTSVLELVNTFQRVNNINIPIEFSSRRVGDCAIIVADNSLAISLLDWSPKRSLEEMCKSGWKWQSLNPGGYQ